MNRSKSDTLTRSDLAQLIHLEVGLSKHESLDIINAFFAQIESALLAGETVKIARFGTICLHQKPACIGRNIKAGKAIKIPPKKVIKFSASRKLTQRVNAALTAQKTNHRFEKA